MSTITARIQATNKLIAIPIQSVPNTVVLCSISFSFPVKSLVPDYRCYYFILEHFHFSISYRIVSFCFVYIVSRIAVHCLHKCGVHLKLNLRHPTFYTHTFSCTYSYNHFFFHFCCIHTK